MANIRKIRKVVTGKASVDGAGVKLVRVFGYHDTADFDPFLMLDAFDSERPDDYIKGFPWHPHRGIETITYLIRGVIEHGDSLGNQGTILDGQCQWMTAGSGIIHQELPQPCPKMFGIQLWLNLPAQAKMAPPKYRSLTQTAIPVIQDDGQTIRLIAGTYQGKPGALQGDYCQPLMLDVELAPEVGWSLVTAPDDKLFVYILQGAAVCDPQAGEPVPAKHAVLFEAGDQLRVKATSAGARFLLLAGKALGEPIAWGGPIVMNTPAELELAFKELDENTFIKHPASGH